MVGFASIYPLLKEGRFPPYHLVEAVVLNFHQLTPEEQTKLIVLGRKIPPVKEILKKKLPLEDSIKTALLQGELMEVPVPVVDPSSNSGKISRIYLIKNSPKLWTNLQEYQSILVNKIKPLTGKNFIALFEEKLEGYSFLLPLAVALIKPQLLENFCFSGNLEADGKLIPVSGIKEKTEACRKEEKTLITSNDFENLAQLLEYLGSTPKPLPIFIATKNRPLDVLKQNFKLLTNNIKNYLSEDFFKRVINDLPYKDLGFLTKGDDWKRALELFERWIEKLDATFEDAELHIALDGPAALAFAYGIMHGTHKRAVFYHFHGGNYYPLVVVNEETSRGLKKFVKDPKLVEWDFLPYEGRTNTDTLAVVLDMVSHPIAEKVKQFLKEENIKADILLITHSERGNLNINRLWTEDIAEIFSLIREYFNKKPYEEILFFFGTPVALAFGLGVAFGHYAKGKIYSYFPNRKPQYVEVLKLEEIKKVR